MFITEEKKRIIKDEKIEKIKDELETPLEKELFETGIKNIKKIRNGKVYQEDINLILKYLIIAVEFVKEQEGKANEQVK
jgi:hypothetical protein